MTLRNSCTSSTPSAPLSYLVGQPAHAEALALMRDTRWDVPGAGPVPLLTQPEGWTAAWLLTRLRAREALRVTKRRWAQAAGGAAGAGALAGALGGLLLVAAPTSRTPLTAVVALVALGALAGFTGAAGVAAGIVSAEALSRSRRGLAIVAGGAIGGLLIGAAVQVVAIWTLADLFGSARTGRWRDGRAVSGRCHRRRLRGNHPAAGRRYRQADRRRAMACRRGDGRMRRRHGHGTLGFRQPHGRRPDPRRWLRPPRGRRFNSHRSATGWANPPSDRSPSASSPPSKGGCSGSASPGA